LLGHASILTTERYDHQRLEALQAAVERLEGGKTFDPTIDASDDVSRIFQVRAEQRVRAERRPGRRIGQKSLTACALERWYRYGESNPGPVAENHVS
jgi:hypothetical protein